MYMPALIFFAILDLERKSTFMDRHKLNGYTSAGIVVEFPVFHCL